MENKGIITLWCGSTLPRCFENECLKWLGSSEKFKEAREAPKSGDYNPWCPIPELPDLTKLNEYLNDILKLYHFRHRWMQ